MRKTKELVLAFVLFLFKRLKLRDYLVFESSPSYSDNTKYVFNEIIRRGWNRQYRCYWFIGNDEVGRKLEISDIPNVYFIDAYHGNFLRNFYMSVKKTRILCQAKAVITCNKMLQRGGKDSGQYYINLAHGEALKNCSNHYNLNDSVDEVMCLSPYLAKYDAINFNCAESLMLPLGYARNDVLLSNDIDVHTLFPDAVFCKAVYWMPTYRQHAKTGQSVSSIQMPIIYNDDIARTLNEAALNNGVLIIIKPHPAQNVSGFKSLKLSNLVLINDAFLAERKIENYQLLASVDALISDYSSVYYDYLLCDKPIALCFDDFEEYKKNEGFTVNPDIVLAGGEKIYTARDMCSFLSRVANGEDKLREKRNKIKKLCHKYPDNQSAKRIVDRIEEKLGT